jgi:fructokinase
VTRRGIRVGVDLGGTKIEAVALAPSGDVASRRRVATPRDDYVATLEAIREVVEAVEAESGAGPGPVGLGIPGTLSPATGRVKNANSTWLNHRPLREDLETRLGRPIRCANDANCFALSEASDGAAAGAGVVFGVILGTGVGGGLVVRGEVWTGPNAVAGEWGHNPLPWAGPGELPGTACWCGRRGCVETWLSGPALARDFAASSGRSLSAEALPAAAAAGDAEAEAALERYVDRLGRGLSLVVNTLDPDVIVLGGGLSNLERLYAELPSRLARHVFTDRLDSSIRPPLHGDSSGVRGAAWLWPADPPV